MRIIQNREAEKLTVALEGRLDTITAPEFDSVLADLPVDVTELVIDMGALEYISSAGLRVILKGQKLMAHRKGMKVINASESIMEVFEITGFADILTIE